VRRNVAVAMSTLTVLVLLFSYRTSLGRDTPGTHVAVPLGAGTGSAGTGSSGTGSGTGTGTGPSTASPDPGTSTSTRSGTFTGQAVDTRWGAVQVQITVRNGKITDAQAVRYPQENPRDQEINSYALPQLAQETLQAQSARIDAVSGATVTSEGYITSLQSAIDAAHL
jgi:uncharacterized protein with FMN-binding domain